MARKSGKKRRPTKRGNGKKQHKGLPGDVRTTTVKAELAKASHTTPAGTTSVAASLLTAPSREASLQLLANQTLGNTVAAEKRRQLPKGPLPIIEKRINTDLVEDWKAALPPTHPSRLYSGSVLLNPQTSLRTGTY